MKKCVFVTVYFLALSLLVSCSQSSSDNKMYFDKIRYIDKFPKSYSIANDIPVELDIIGMKNFVINDSLLIVSTTNRDGIWTFYSLKDYKCLGTFLQQGDGPYEFIEAPNISNTDFFHEADTLFARIYDSQRGKLYNMNINKSLNTKKSICTIITDSLPTFLFNLIMIDSTSFLCKEIQSNERQQIRYILSKNKRTTTNNLDKLNQATIRENEDFNILSSITKRNNKNGLIVEVPVNLNYINIYSINDSSGLTICTDKKVDNIDKIQNTAQWERKYIHANLRLFDNFFGVLCINEKEIIYQTKRIKYPTIQLFNWNGEPLVELELNHFATAFDIDFANGYLYAIDHQTDEFFKYNIQNILKNI